MNPVKRYSRKKISFKRKSKYKRFFLFSFGAVIFALAAGVLYFNPLKEATHAASDTNSIRSKNKKITAIDKKSSQNKSSKSNQSEKHTPDEIEFTFFNTLTKSEKHTPEPALKKKKQISFKSNSEEKKEQELLPPNNSTQYIIQASSFRKKSLAEALKKRLDDLGYRVTIETAEIPNKGLWYRVFLTDKFADRAAALKLIEKINHEGNLSAFLKNSRNGK